MRDFPRAHHYNFIYEALPSTLNRFPKELFAYVTQNRSKEMIKLIYNFTLENFSYFEPCELQESDIFLISMWVGNIPSIFVKMPRPSGLGEVYYAFCLFESNRNKLNTRYFIVRLIAPFGKKDFFELSQLIGNKILPIATLNSDKFKDSLASLEKYFASVY